MNEKYIQALILGSIIGFAIVIDDYIGPKPNHRMMKKHIMIKDSKNSNWREKSGKKINLHELEGHDVLEFKSDDDGKKIMPVVFVIGYIVSMIYILHHYKKEK